MRKGSPAILREKESLGDLDPKIGFRKMHKVPIGSGITHADYPGSAQQYERTVRRIRAQTRKSDPRRRVLTHTSALPGTAALGAFLATLALGACSGAPLPQSTPRD